MKSSSAFRSERVSDAGRRAFVCGLTAICLTAAHPAAAQTSGSGTAAKPASAPVYVISRKRLLNESRPTRVLRAAEGRLIARLQRQVDRAKQMFAAEEVELARRRSEFSRKEMSARASDFDLRVRTTRRKAQNLAKKVQKAFQEARGQLVLKLPPVLEKLRTQTGAVAILDSDQVLAIDPGHDLTDRAIAMVNRLVKPPVPPEIDVTLEIPKPKFPMEPRKPAPAGGTDKK